MKWISSRLCSHLFLATALLFSTYVYADIPPSPRQSHPLSWMHGLPVGEQPGWSAPWWMNFEISGGNVWNAPLKMDDLRNGKRYEYMADFEQAHAVLEVGRAFGNWLGASVEVPYAYRSGGMMDDFIDDFHILIGNRRFNRQYYPQNQNVFSVTTDDVDYYTQESLRSGIANLKLKLKFWLLKWQGDQEGSCPCGISISSQTKFPIGDVQDGGTNGDIDQSALIHIGVPLFSESAMWFTAGYTWLGDNPAMKDWPRFESSILYEGAFDFSLTQGWGLHLSARAESPFLDRKHLQYYDVATDPQIISRNRAASGWNSLVHWRGTQSFGLRYKPSDLSVIQLLMSEDWGIGPYDADDDIYTNNAADVSFTLQMKLSW